MYAQILFYFTSQNTNLVVIVCVSLIWKTVLLSIKWKQTKDGNQEKNFQHVKKIGSAVRHVPYMKTVKVD